MGGKPKNSTDLATAAKTGGKHGTHRAKHPGRPCPNPPAAPTGLAFTFKVREKKTHLEYSAKIKWNGVFEDEQGHKIPGGGVEIDHYEVIYWPTDNTGAPIENEDGEARVRRAHIKSVKGIKVTNAVMISGSIAEFTTKKAHNFVVGETVRVQDCKPLQYNGKFDITNIPSTTKFRGDIGVAAPKDLEDEGTVEGEPDPSYGIIIEHIPNPKKWWWKAKCRAWDSKNCPSDWSTVGPLKPTQEARPQPPAPGFVSLSFDRKGGKKHNAFRGLVKISPVGFWDIPGYDAEDDVARYRVKVQVSNDGLTDWRLHTRLHVRDKDDEQEDANITLPFRHVRRRNYYRVYLASEDRFNRVGDYAGPYPSSVGVGVGGTPDAVNNVQIKRPGPRRLVAIWDEPNQPEDIDYYKIEWWRRNPLTLMETNKSRNRNDVYRVPEEDKGKAHFCKVYAVDEDDNQSTAVQPADETETGEYPGAVAGNPPNVPSLPTLSFDGRGTRHAKHRAIVLAGTSTVDGTHDAAHRYIIQLAHDAVDGGASPPAGAKRQHGAVEGDATGDDMYEIFRNLPKRHHVWARERARNSAGASAWTSWVHATRPIDTGVAVAPAMPTGISVTTPAPRRVLVTWNEPDDDETIRWRVEIRRAGVTVETGYTRSTRYVYHVPKPYINVAHRARVFAISDTGTDSSQVESLDGVPTDDPGTPIGSIRWHAGPAIPTGHMHCDGTTLNATVYPALYGAIGSTYNPSRAYPSFDLPDIKNRKVKAKGNLGNLADNEGLAEGSRNDSHGHNNHKHGNHAHSGHQHNSHNHSNHKHPGHTHDDHVGTSWIDDNPHGHGASSGPYDVGQRATGTTNTPSNSHYHFSGGSDANHKHNVGEGGYYIRGRFGNYYGYHGEDGNQGESTGDGQNGFGEWLNDNKGDQVESTNDNKRSPHIVLWAIIRVDDI